MSQNRVTPWTLVFDDDLAIARKILRKFNEETRLPVLAADSVVQAVELLEDHKLEIGAIVTDIVIPKRMYDSKIGIYDGLDILRFAQSCRRDILMYVLSVNADEKEEIARAQAMGLPIRRWFPKLNYRESQSPAPWILVERDLSVSPLESLSVGKEFMYDIFLAHNSSDRVFVRDIAEALKRHGLDAWIDENNLPPGSLFQAEVERALPLTRAFGICVGPSGISPWMNLELRAAISQFSERRSPVIPIVLPGGPRLADLPAMLREFSGVEFSDSAYFIESIGKLAWGIRGHELAEDGAR